MCLVGDRTVLEQERKWMVENHEGNQEIVLSQTDSRQTVYIYNCHKSVIQVWCGVVWCGVERVYKGQQQVRAAGLHLVQHQQPGPADGHSAQ
jgi:hypothetical protein